MTGEHHKHLNIARGEEGVDGANGCVASSVSASSDNPAVVLLTGCQFSKTSTSNRTVQQRRKSWGALGDKCALDRRMI